MARFTLDGRAEMVFLSSLPSSPTAPTQAELAAGTDLVGTKQTEELAEIQGFEPSPSSIPTPGYASSTTGNVAGELTYPDAVMSFYKDSNSSTIYDLLVEGLEGWIAMGLDGFASGEEIEIFPVGVVSNVRRKARNAPNIFDVTLSTDAPFKGTQAA